MLFFSWRRALEQRRETHKRLAAEARARELAMQDPLTGLPNRRQFIDGLNAAIAAPPRAGASHALLMLDLNRFKQVNDLYGHHAGDEALVVIGSRLLGAVRDGDLIVFTIGEPIGIEGGTNTMKIVKVGEHRRP